MNADRIAISCGQRAHAAQSQNPFIYETSNRPAHASIGMALCTIQQTKCDHLASLRIFEKLDDVMTELASAFNIPPEMYTRSILTYTPSLTPSELGYGVYTVPYDGTTGRLSVNRDVWTKLDLRVGAKLKITAGMDKGCAVEVVGCTSEGHDHVVVTTAKHELVSRMIGAWWLEAAVTGVCVFVCMYVCMYVRGVRLRDMIMWL
jgi:hypothetical protein